MKRFKQKALATAVAASALTLASTAGAVAINPNGHGEALIYPYYTARDGQETLITLVNTTNRAKALKVRFREARNSNDVLDFNLFLSPFDVWTAKVSQRLDRAYLQTADTSCTNPPKTNWINDGNGVFGMFMFPFDYIAVDGGAAQDGDRTLEGYLEVIEMASFTDQAGNDFANLFTAVKHNANGVAPCTSNNTVAQLALSGSRALFGSGVNRFGDDVFADLLQPPSGGLFGSATIISTSGASGGTSTGYSATAYTGFNRDARIERRQLGIPSFADHNSCVGVIQTDDPAPVLTAWYGIRTVPNVNLNAAGTCQNAGGVNFAFAAGEFATPLAAAAAGNLSERLHARALAFIIPNMAASISGEYAFMGDGSIHGTDWVITMPGKHYFVNRPTVVSGMYHGHVPPVGGPPPTFTAMRPFSQMWDTTNRRSCDDAVASSYSREEHDAGGGLLFSPLPPGGNALCFETNVISFGQQINATAPSSVFRSQVARWVNPSAAPPAHYGTGWMTLDLTNGSATQGLLLGSYHSVYTNINLSTYIALASGHGALVLGTFPNNTPNNAGAFAFTRIPGLPVVGFKATTSKFQQGNATTPANNYTDSSNLVFRRVIVP